MRKSYDILIVGAGIFGLPAAIELNKRGYTVGIINPDKIPHPLAASTDISKVVRMEYGSDAFYFKMAEDSIEGWYAWNDLFSEILYHEVGFLLLMQYPIDHPKQTYEMASRQQLKAHGYDSEILDTADIEKRYPLINPRKYPHAHFNSKAGFVESAKVLSRLSDYARSLGVDVHTGHTAEEIIRSGDQVKGIRSQEGANFFGERVIISAGAYTPLLVPELQSQMMATGHPVFHIKPSNKQGFDATNLPVFAADISNTGWYGFPLHPEEGVVKMAKHTNGLIMNANLDDRRIVDKEVDDFRSFLGNSFIDLPATPLVFTRRCLYTDTLDGDFWIDQHPLINGLYIATGGSGHGMKMGPVLGIVIADLLEEKPNAYLSRFVWRDLQMGTKQREEARFVEGGSLGN